MHPMNLIMIFAEIEREPEMKRERDEVKLENVNINMSNHESRVKGIAISIISTHLMDGYFAQSAH